LDRYRIGTETGCIIVSGENSILRAAVNGSHYTGQSKGVQFMPHHTLSRARHFIVHNTIRKGIGGERGGRRQQPYTSLPVTPRRRSTGSWTPVTDDQMMPHPLHQQEVITTVSTVNHSNLSTN